jgi:hypothetical protein
LSWLNDPHGDKCQEVNSSLMLSHTATSFTELHLMLSPHIVTRTVSSA